MRYLLLPLIVLSPYLQAGQLCSVWVYSLVNQNIQIKRLPESQLETLSFKQIVVFETTQQKQRFKILSSMIEVDLPNPCEDTFIRITKAAKANGELVIKAEKTYRQQMLIDLPVLQDLLL